MDIYEAIAARRTIRDFEQRTVDKDTVRKLIAAGLQAPTHDHLREWRFVAVQDIPTRMTLIEDTIRRRTRQETEELIDGWGMADETQREMYLDAIPKQFSMLLEAGCLIVPCFRQKTPLLEPETLSSLNAFASIWCCIENILVAAASEGIFGVTRIPSSLEVETIRRVLGVPSDYEVPCWLALGYPAAGARRTGQIRVTADERLHLDRW